MDPYDDLSPEQLDVEAQSQPFSVEENLAQWRTNAPSAREQLAGFLRFIIWTISVLAVVLGVLFFFVGLFGASSDELGTELYWWSMLPFAIWISAVAISLTAPAGVLRSAATDGPTMMVATGCVITYLGVAGWFSELYYRLSWQDFSTGGPYYSWPRELPREAALQISTSTLLGANPRWQGIPNGSVGQATTIEMLLGVALLVVSVAIAVHHIRRPRATASPSGS